jgi:hypothetical protein
MRGGDESQASSIGEAVGVEPGDHQGIKGQASYVDGEAGPKKFNLN